MEKKDQEVHPAGSLPLGGDGDTSQPEEQATGGKQEETGGTGEPKLLAGKYKSAEDLETAYGHLEKELGRQSTEVGALRKQQELATKQQELLLNQLSSLQSAGPKSAGPAEPDFKAQIADLKNKVETGDIDLGTALEMTAELTAQKAGQVAEQKITGILQQKDLESAKKDFMTKHPDFLELQTSGALAALRAENPLHDDFSAYFDFKSREAQTQTELAAKAALEEGKVAGAKIAAGAEAAGRVLGKAGATPRAAVNTQPKNDGEKIDGMLGVLQKIRGG